jgi:hypothetical protein
MGQGVDGGGSWGRPKGAGAHWDMWEASRHDLGPAQTLLGLLIWAGARGAEMGGPADREGQDELEDLNLPGSV